MNFIRRVSVPQRVRLRGLAFLVTAATACGGGHRVSTTPPVDPEGTVRAFLSAVKVNNLIGMRDLWGSERGPAATYLNTEEVDQRLSVIRAFLEHERFEFAQPNEVDPANSAQRIVKVRLSRKGCQPVVPFTTVRWSNGWLVKNIDLPSAGNPARACDESQPASAPPPGT